MTAPSTLPLTDTWQLVPDGVAIGEGGADVSLGLGGKTFARRHLDGRPISADPPGWAELRALLMRGGGFGCWWTASQARNDKGQPLEKLTTWWDVSFPADLPRDTGPDGPRNLYFGVYPVGTIPKRTSQKTGKQIPRQYVRAEAKDIRAVNCVFAEFDLKDFGGDFAKLQAFVDALPLRPTVAIYSGGGLHCYWIFIAPILITTTDELECAKALQAGWVNLLGGDKTVKDLARVLRVPGTLNYKYTPPRPVSFAWCELERLFDPEQIRALLPKPSPNGHKPAQAPATPNNLDDQTLIEKARNAKNGAAFTQLWQGGVNGHRSQSEADLALCSNLAYWTGADASRMDRLFRTSGLMRDKWDQTHNGNGMTYGEMTIQKAIASTTNTYSPNGHSPTLGQLGAASPATERPQIVVNNRQLRDKTEDAVAALVRVNIPPQILVRNGALVRVFPNEDKKPLIELFNDQRLRERLSEAADFVQITTTKDGPKTTSVSPGLDLVQNVLAKKDWAFPRLVGIVECPVLRPDGTVLKAPGYDAETGLVYWPDPALRVPDIPDAPSPAQVAAALALWREPWEDFPFVDDASRANALALMLTRLVRENYAGLTPGLAINGTNAGEGKALAIDIVALVATGRPAGMSTIAKGEELRKDITSKLQQGDAIICYDNVVGVLYSPVLAAAITAQFWNDRTLGQSKAPSVPNRAVWVITGNSIQLGGDLPRRFVFINIDAKLSKPWLRTEFKHADLREWVLTNRGELIAAGLTLARAWFAAGGPEANTPRLGSFEAWARVLGGILAHAGVRGFLGNLMQMYDQADEEGAAWETFLLALLEHFKNAPKTVAEISEALAANDELRAKVPDLGQEIVDEKILSDGKVIAIIRPKFKQALGTAFKARAGRRHGDRQVRVERHKTQDTHAKVAQWVFAGTLEKSPQTGVENTANLDICGDCGDSTSASGYAKV